MNRPRLQSYFFKSLRFRILLIVLILGVLPCGFVGFNMIQAYKERAADLRISNVKNQGTIISDQLVEAGYMEQQQNPVINSQLDMLSNVYDGRILVLNRDFVVIKDTYNLDEGKIMISPDAIACFRGQSFNRYEAKGQFLEVTIPVRNQQDGQIQGVMMMNISASEIASNSEAIRQRAILLSVWMAVLITGLAIVLSGILVRPLTKITKAIEDITDGYQNEQIAVKDYTETELITEAFNKMLNRMKILDESRQEFVSNVSHELKTPMTSMKVLADSLVGQENVPNELYQEFMKDITVEIDRENKIITDLLSLVKMDKKAADINIQHKNINGLLEAILKRLRPIADKRNIDLILDSFRPVDADVDEVKFTLAISNLVENGIKYNVDDGWVRVSIDADHKYFYVTVADSGMGIPEESVERIFERFYRVDKSHSKEIGGTGLGLAITKEAVVAHHGAIKVYSKEEEGTTFSVRIPLSYIP